MGADKGATPRPLDQSLDQSSDTIEASLAASLRAATKAGCWDVAAMLARELEARRLARMKNVVVLDAAKRRR
jgi:hypothetical protein